jgi:tetratricopeptide (TPR) repeat protein
MKWWMNCYLNTEFCCLLAVAVSGGALLFADPPLSAQETIEQQYNKAMALFHAPDFEGACDEFQKINQESPGYGRIQVAMKLACDWKKSHYDDEREAFNKGENYFGLKQYDEAKQQFEKARDAGKLLKSPNYKSQTEAYLRKIDAEASDERLYQEAVSLFDQKKYDEAYPRFSQVAERGGREAANAQSYLTKIDKLNHDAQILQTFKRAVHFFEEHNYTQASRDFQRVVDAGGPKTAEAHNYLNIIRHPTPTPPPVPPKPEQPADVTLRKGLVAFYDGRLDEAESYLKEYVEGNGQKKALAYFFRGVAHSTQYFISGEKNAHQKQLALEDFDNVRKLAVEFRPPEEYVSPKVLALYTSVAR